MYVCMYREKERERDLIMYVLVYVCYLLLIVFWFVPFLCSFRRASAPNLPTKIIPARIC